MICMHHTFKILNADGSKETITSTLINYGVKGGNTSMARTVTIPVAIAISKILSGEITNTGVVRPTTADIYVPILKEMSDKVCDGLRTLDVLVSVWCASSYLSMVISLSIAQ